MIEGFDKEIDALLRQTAKGETAFAAANPESKIQNPKSVHLDADEISAFAENALPEKARVNYTAHFADCDRCRKILSNTMLLNSEAETVPASSSAASPGIVTVTNIPWYRRLFAFPNAAYAMGALVVLFGGFLAFTVLQNVNNSQMSEVSVVSESQSKSSGPNAESEPDFSTADTMSNMSVSSMNSASNAMMSNSASVNSSNASTSSSVINNAAGQPSNANSSAANTSPVKKDLPLNEAKREAEKNLAENKNEIRLDGVTADSSAENQSVTGKQITELPINSRSATIAQAAPPTATLAKPVEKEKAADKDSRSAKMQKNKTSGESNKQIGGKTFNRREGVWYDSAYNGQITMNVSRGSNEYGKLDSDVRSIAENLSGTVIVVWKSKAYRIQ